MELSEILGDSFEYARKLVKEVGRWIVLIVLNFIPIVNWIVIGYMAKVIEASPGSNEPPKLEKYGSLWIQGLKITVLSLIYMIIPAALLGLGFASMALTPLPWMGRGPAFLAPSVGLLLIIAGMALAFLIAILYTIALAHMVKNRSFAKGLAVKEILEIIGKVGWGKYIVWLIVMFVIGLVIFALSRIPYVGWLIYLIVSPLYMVFIGRSIGLIYEEGAPKPTPKEIVEAAIEAMKFCIQCGARIPADARFCPICGAAQE